VNSLLLYLQAGSSVTAAVAEVSDKLQIKVLLCMLYWRLCWLSWCWVFSAQFGQQNAWVGGLWSQKTVKRRHKLMRQCVTTRHNHTWWILKSCQNMNGFRWEFVRMFMLRGGWGFAHSTLHVTVHSSRNQVFFIFSFCLYFWM